ncbi:hypothetical protein P5673_021601 [Acropora cervicornis]|uniref:Uncharacterized protein n=1 Tax=Acropora cervicornis TaxID=6130 RepID=A0AAD9Q7V4_ACRCE|nr:hypothetical protein P5673_021601 [Acropora cervicornis]
MNFLLLPIAVDVFVDVAEEVLKDFRQFPEKGFQILEESE